MWSVQQAGEVPGVRRRAVRRAEALGGGLWGEAVALVVAELAANALEHGRPPATVALRRRSGRLWVGVFDFSAARPVEAASGVEAESGRGLSLCAAVASGWQVEGAPAGKWVWAWFTVDAAGR